MRLLKSEIEAIHKSFYDNFSEGEVFLFGSRLDDEQRGGDIDLFLIVPPNERRVAKKIDFLISLKQTIPYKKIDVVFYKDGLRPIEQEALKGIRLVKKP